MTPVIAAMRAVDDMTVAQVIEFVESLQSFNPVALRIIDRHIETIRSDLYAIKDNAE